MEAPGMASAAEFDANILRLVNQDIPHGCTELKRSYDSLNTVASYCEDYYVKAQNKRNALEETKGYTTQALASVAYQVNMLATNFLQLLDQQFQQLHTMESSINHLSETISIHKEKVARREIGVLTASKNVHGPDGRHGIIYPSEPERPIKYTRRKIDYSILDNVGHGVKIATEPRPSQLSSAYSPSPLQTAPANRPATPPSSLLQTDLSGPPTPSSGGTLSRASGVAGGHYRGNVKPTVAPQVPSDYQTRAYAMQNAMQQQQQAQEQARQQQALQQQKLEEQMRRSKISSVHDPGNPRASQLSGTERTHPSLPPMTQYMTGYPQYSYDGADLAEPPAPISQYYQYSGGAGYPQSSGGGDASPPLPPPPSSAYASQGEQPMSAGGSGALPQPTALMGVVGPVAGGGGDGYNFPPPMDDFGNSRNMMQQQQQRQQALDDLPDWVPQDYMEKVIAIYDYTAEKEDELSIQEEMVLYVLRKNDDGWWEGVKEGGQRGLFPGNYVEPIL